MTKISVLFLHTFIFFNCGIEAKALVDGMNNEREIQQDEIASQEPLFENSRFANGYDENSGFSKVGSMYDMANYRANLIKRSLREHNPSQRQTGIIYGGGKPIGILQPYQESFKFMPIKEEHVYSVDGGRSNIDQQEPYINLMYPLARFTRSEDAIRMAELEAAKAEFLDKHYPSMLVDFKIHNKLHPSGYNAKSSPTFNLKREENNPTSNDKRKKKRESRNSDISGQKLHKREDQHVQKRDNSMNKKQTEQISTPQKREDRKETHKRTEKSTASIQEQQTDSEYSNTEQNKSNMKKRQSRLTDSEFENLKKGVSKRNSNGNIQVIEEDLKGLLSDMGLIEDDLEENAEEMEESKSALVQDEDSEEALDTTVQKEKEEPQVDNKRDNQMAPERKKRARGEQMESRIPSLEKRSSDSSDRSVNPSPKERSAANEPGKRFIEVSFTSKDDKTSLGGNANEQESCPSKPSVIPNKREIKNEKQERSVPEDKRSVSKRSEEPSLVTTETYDQYEQRVAREIKNKIKQLKEEVKRELGAFEPDKEEEDDDETVGESQRKKRFIVNTLMDEETHNIDPNENLENSELEPHVRRRRTLSTDMMTYGSPKAPLSLYGKDEDVHLINFDSDSVQKKNDFGISGYSGESVGHGQLNINQELFRKDDITQKDAMHSNVRTRTANNINHNLDDETGSQSYRWNDSPMYLKAGGKLYFPEYQRGSPDKFVALTSRRSSRNDLNSESGSSNDYEGDALNSDSEEETDATMNSVVDLTRNPAERTKSVNRQQFSARAEHSPKKLQSYNQKYVYYYVGGNRNDKNNRMTPSLTNAHRMNPMYKYQRWTGHYPNQFYNTMNRFHGKQYKAANVNGVSNNRAFQTRFDKPSARRRKRFVNLMIPPYAEDAIVTNTFPRNTSVPAISNNWINSRSGKPKITFGIKTIRSAEENGTNEEPRNMTGQPLTETGKIISRTNRDVSREKALVPWDSVMKKYIVVNQARSSNLKIQLNDGTQRKNGNPYKPRNSTIFKNHRNTGHAENFYEHRSNSDYTNTMQRSEPEVSNLGNVQLAEKSKETNDNGGKFTTRKMSWLVHEDPEVIQGKAEILDPEVTSSGNSIKTNCSGNPELDNNANKINDYHKKTDEEEYDYYTDSVATSISDNSSVQQFDTETTTIIDIIEELTTIPPSNPDEIRLSDKIIRGDSSEKNIKSSNRTFVDITDLNSTDLGADKNNLIVQNANLISEERKRRKRSIQPEYHQDVRRKRYWLWPSLTFPRSNAPQMDEEEEEYQNGPSMFQERQGSKRSSDKIDLSFENDAEGGIEDFANEPRSYDRNKRNSESKLYLSGNKSPYFHTNRGSSSFMPAARNRRYVRRKFREPPQQLLTEMTDAELFGALPQSYAGELARYKRVKRRYGEAYDT